MNFLLTPILYYVVDKYSIYHPHIENQYIFTYSPQSPYGTGCCYHPAPHLDRNCLDLFIIICLAIAVITFLHNRMMTVVEITMRPVNLIKCGSPLPDFPYTLWRCIEGLHHTTSYLKMPYDTRAPLFVFCISLLESIYMMTDILLTAYQPCVKEYVIHEKIYVNCNIMQL